MLWRHTCAQVGVMPIGRQAANTSVNCDDLAWREAEQNVGRGHCSHLTVDVQHTAAALSAQPHTFQRFLVTGQNCPFKRGKCPQLWTINRIMTGPRAYTTLTQVLDINVATFIGVKNVFTFLTFYILPAFIIFKNVSFYWNIKISILNRHFCRWTTPLCAVYASNNRNAMRWPVEFRHSRWIAETFRERIAFNLQFRYLSTSIQKKHLSRQQDVAEYKNIYKSSVSSVFLWRKLLEFNYCDIW